MNTTERALKQIKEIETIIIPELKEQLQCAEEDTDEYLHLLNDILMNENKIVEIKNALGRIRTGATSTTKKK